MTAATIPEKVRPLVRLLASPVDAEALGAARGLGRVLDAAGLGFDDLASAIPTRPRQPCEVLAPRGPRRQGHVFTPAQEGQHRRVARHCLQVGRDRLRPADRRFLFGIVDRPSRLTIPQSDWLNDIVCRLDEVVA